ncbi:hypothetical protein Ahia01_000425300 [Argonauta hians]
MDISDITTRVKTGSIIHYQKKIFSKDWKKKYLALNSDSSLEWFQDKQCTTLEGDVNLQQVMSFVGIGESTRNIPGRPKLPSYGQDRLLMALPNKPCRDCKIEWFLFTDDESLRSWVEAIKSTLPAPQLDAKMGAPGCLDTYASMLPQPTQSLPSLPPPTTPGTITGGAYYLPTSMVPPRYPPMYQQQVPRMAPVGYPMVQPVQQQTVIIQEQRSSNDGFFSGLLLGDALGFGLGAGWSACNNYGGFDDNTQNIQINNYYDVNNTNIDNTSFTDIDNTFDTNNLDFGGGGGDFCDGGIDF